MHFTEITSKSSKVMVDCLQMEAGEYSWDMRPTSEYRAHLKGAELFRHAYEPHVVV